MHTYTDTHDGDILKPKYKNKLAVNRVKGQDRARWMTASRNNSLVQ